MSDRFAMMGPEQLLYEARRLDAENNRLASLLEAQRLVTALLDAVLAVPYEQPLACSSAARSL